LNAWSNISTASPDPEISRIDAFETGLGKLPRKVRKIRELITRFEVCHFKYQKHINVIRDSIVHLEPQVIPEKIGSNHIQHGETAWPRDSTGRSLLGQKYIWAFNLWLNRMSQKEIPDDHDRKLTEKVNELLGDKNDDRKRLVQLLVSRLTWEWESYERLQRGGEFEELEFQICRMDICHYAFPQCLESVIQGIGEMKPVDGFEGCGTFSNEIRQTVRNQLDSLNHLFVRFQKSDPSDPAGLIKAWLVACMIKTMKEQTQLPEPRLLFLSKNQVQKEQDQDGTDGTG